ncbi:MAG: hypothetical protein ABJO02_11200 [Reichenbachiella sp.]|uniref:hypothetical protein n=1 Tax=Reichenbachiella sp. TaxID=2184521 RepID=UPI0032995B7C
MNLNHLTLTLLLIFVYQLSLSQTQKISFEKGELEFELDKRYMAREENGVMWILFDTQGSNFQLSANYMQGMNLEQAYNFYYLEGMPNEGVSFKHIEGCDRSIFGRKYKWAKFSTKEGAIKYEHVIYLTQHNDQIYHFVATSTSIYNLIPDLEMIVQSMKYTPVQPLKKVIMDEDLKLASSKKWKIYTEDVSGFVMPFNPTTARHISISKENITHYKFDGSIINQSPYEYDQLNKKINYKYDGRKAFISILNVSSSKLVTSEYDGFDEEVVRSYKPMK